MKPQRTTNRRTVLKTLGAGVIGGAVLTGSASASDEDYGNGNGIGAFLNEEAVLKKKPIWNTGIADRMGNDEVTVDVGNIVSIDVPEEDLPPELEEPPEEGPFGFSPRAVKVSPETTVVWEWTGNSFVLNPGEPWPHDVASLDESDGDHLFHSPHQGEGSFEYEFDDTGTYLYYCTPHGNPGPDYPNLFGMRGAIIVSDD